MFHVVYVPHIDEKLLKFEAVEELHEMIGCNTPDKWLREETGYEKFQDAWVQVAAINERETQITCLVFSDVTNNIHFPAGLLPGYPFNEEEK